MSSIEDDQKAWIAHAASHYGYGRVTIHDSSSLLFEFVRTSSGRVHDSVRLRNDHAQAHRCNAAVLEGAKTGAAEPPASRAAAAAPALLESVPEAAAGVEENSGVEPILETSDDEDVLWEDDEEADAQDSQQWLQAFSGLTTAHAGAAVSAS